MYNWKDAVGFQPTKADATEPCKCVFAFMPRTFHASGPAFYEEGVVTEPEKGEVAEIAFSIEKLPVLPEDYKYAEHEVRDVVLATLKQLPYHVINPQLAPEMWQFDVQAGRHKVAKDTRRGIANHRYQNIWWYKSVKMPYDAPIFVAEFEGKYAVVKHPKFELYGFQAVQAIPWVSNALDLVGTVTVL